MAPPREHEPTETSPLISPNSKPLVSEPLNGTIENGTTADGAAVVSVSAGDDPERRDSVDDSRAAQFEGNAEARKLLKFIVPAVSIGVFLSAADQTIVVASYGIIGSDLGALNLTSWIGTGYFLTLASIQPLYGKLSDIFGRRGCLLVAYAIFGLGCLFCGLSANMGQLIAARVVQGIGGGGMTTVVSILFSDIVPLKERGLWQGIINIVFAVGAATGAPLGGIFADSVGWRWAFLVQAPICLVALIAAFFTVRLPQKDQSDWLEKLRRIDFLGAIVLVCAVFGLIFGLDRGSNVAWSQPISYVPLASSLLLFTPLFIYVETRVALEPFAPGRVILSRAMSPPFLTNFFSMSAWLAALYYVPLYFQAVDGLSATGAALRLLPAVLASVTGSLGSGLYMRRTGKYYTLTIVAYTLLPLGLLIITLFSGGVSTNPWLIGLGLVVAALGNGIGVTTSLIALISNADPADQAVATACSYLFRSLGTVVGIALVATVIQQSLRDALREALRDAKDAERIERGVRSSLEFIRTLKDPEVRALVRGCYGVAVRRGYALMIGLALGATVASWFVREKKLSR